MSKEKQYVAFKRKLIDFVEGTDVTDIDTIVLFPTYLDDIWFKVTNDLYNTEKKMILVKCEKSIIKKLHHEIKSELTTISCQYVAGKKTALHVILDISTIETIRSTLPTEPVQTDPKNQTINKKEIYENFKKQLHDFTRSTPRVRCSYGYDTEWTIVEMRPTYSEDVTFKFGAGSYEWHTDKVVAICQKFIIQELCADFLSDFRNMHDRLKIYGICTKSKEIKILKV
jgi:hypothetical protein